MVTCPNNQTWFRVISILLTIQILIFSAMYLRGTSLPLMIANRIPINIHLFDTTSNKSIIVDIHNEFNFEDHPNHSTDLTAKNRTLRIGIALGITTRKSPDINGDKMVSVMPFYRSLLKTFCQTCSAGYSYNFFMAYDYNDGYFSKTEFLEDFTKHFYLFVKSNCTPKSTYDIHFVKCSHTKKPAWAQNDAMIEAYLSGMDFSYRINDDTLLKTPKWTEAFVSELNGMSPPRLGVVGPKHKGGNTRILTYDFTHRTHVDIFGFHYPREFPDWHGDRWITDVYKPSRSVKLTNILLVHTMEKGQRYRTTRKSPDLIIKTIKQGQEKVERYVKSRENPQIPDPRKVIAISLYSSEPNHLWGAIRNAHLAPVMFPGWSLRVYTEAKHSKNESLHIPARALDLLTSCGATVVYTDTSDVPPEAASFLVADDTTVDFFLIRHPAGRLSERDFSSVNDWLVNPQNRTIHSIKDHPKHNNVDIANDLWGAKAADLRRILGGTTMREHLINYYKYNTFKNGTQQTQTFLQNALKDDLTKLTMIHDGINCETSSGLVPLSVQRTNKQFVGQMFDVNELPLNFTEDMILFTNSTGKCVKN